MSCHKTTILSESEFSFLFYYLIVFLIICFFSSLISFCVFVYIVFKSSCRLSQSVTSHTPEYSLVSSAKLTSLDA